MADLDKITQQVLDKEKAALDQKVEEERKLAQEEIQAAKESAEDKNTKQSERINQDVSNQYDIDQNSIRINERNEKLKIKQTYIEKVFDKVQLNLDNLDQSSFKAFVEGVLKQFANHDQLEIVLGEQSNGLIDQAWLDTLALDNLSVTIADHTIPNESGLILQDDHVEFNYLFSELIKNSKNEYIRHIDQVLFQ